jgi:cation:H+ antiporter
VTVLMLLAGLVLLVAGGELLVRGAVAVARAIGVSPLMIGLTLVGFGTSTPELVTSVQAALVGSPGVAIGNVVGSNICNILLILGVAALVRPISASPKAFRRDGPVLVGVTLLCVGVLLWGEVGRLFGVVFIAGLIAYILATYLLEREGADPAAAMHAVGAEVVPARAGSLVRAVPMAVAGLVLVVVGAGWLVDAAITLAAALGVSDTLIGLTVVAVGTSLPELTASLIAARRGQSDLAFGNVVGSNIYNILGILGVTALVKPIAVPPEIVAFDVWAMLAATLLLVVVTVTGWRINRFEGGALVACYVGYLAWLVVGAMRAGGA